MISKLRVTRVLDSELSFISLKAITLLYACRVVCVLCLCVLGASEEQVGSPALTHHLAA